MNLNRIVVVNNRQIEEAGSHKELLMKSSSLYKRLWERQAGGF